MKNKVLAVVALATTVVAGAFAGYKLDRKSTRPNSSHRSLSRMPSSA